MGDVRWTPADFFHVQQDRMVCTLCAHVCQLTDGQVGHCQVRRRRGASMETATFSTTVNHVDAVERKPLYHFRPGTSAVTLAAPGCSFTCGYCQNWRLSQFGRTRGAAFELGVVDPAALARRAAQAGASIALSYSEPSLAAELTLALAEAAVPLGVPLIWKTNGFLTSSALRRLAPCLAAVNVDVKAADDRSHRLLTGAPLTPVLDAIAAFVARGVWVEVSTPLIPGTCADAASLRTIARHLSATSRDIPWHLARFTPEYQMRALAPTAPDDLRAAVAIGREAGLRHVYVERALGAEGRRTRCPSCAADLVSRGIWTVEAVRLIDGRCPVCHTVVAGCWSPARVEMVKTGESVTL